MKKNVDSLNACNMGYIMEKGICEKSLNQQNKSEYLWKPNQQWRIVVTPSRTRQGVDQYTINSTNDDL
jgi:hypothetical protein